MPYCFCRRASEGFMIYCERCQTWFHGKCVGISKAKANKVLNWFCHWCEVALSERQHLQQQIDALTERVHGVHQQTQPSGNDAHSYQQEVKRLENVLAASQQEKDDLNEQVKRLNSLCDTYQQTQQSGNHSYQQEKEYLEAQVKRLETLHAACQQSKNDLQAQVESLQNLLAASQQEKDCHQCIASKEQQRNLKQELERVSKENENLITKIGNIRKKSRLSLSSSQK